MEKSKTKLKTVKQNFTDTLAFPKLDEYFKRKQDFYFYLSFILLLILSLLLFDIKISDGGDDSEYLMTGKMFIEGTAFPSWHGSFYSILMGLFIVLFGFHLILFKILSLVFLLGHQCLFYYTFRNRISPFLLVSILLIISVNSGIIYFGSQTYTEAFYMFLQSFLFLSNILSILQIICPI
jgi:hypothetical protein